MRKRRPDPAFAVAGGLPPLPAKIRAAFSDQALMALAQGIAVIAIWLLFHPYLGIEHDTWLYTAQALARIYPGRFAEDLFFEFGSQDSFSLFSRLHAPAIKALGISGAAIALAALGQLVWLTGAIHLVARLSRNRKAVVLALLIIAIAPAYYGGLEIFRYGETWAIPRPFAEGLVLHGLALTMAGRHWIGLVAIVASGPLHPLVTLSGLGPWLILRIMADRRWLGLIPAGIGLVIVGAAADVGPLGRLFQTMDGAWLTPVKGRNQYVFASLWDLKDWALLAFHVSAVAAAILVCSGRTRALMTGVLITAVGGTLAGLIGGDWLNNVLIIQLQLWRANWLLAVAAHAALGLLLFRLWRQSDNAAALTIAMIAVYLWSSLAWVRLLALPLVVALIAWEIRHPHLVLSRPIRLTGFGAAVATLIVFIYLRGSYWLGVNPTYWSVAGVPTINHYDVIVFALPVGLLVYHYFRPRPPALVIAALILLAASIGLWDRRHPPTRHIEAMAGAPNPFRAAIETDETVYWRRGLKEAWLLLQRPAYFSSRQGAGILFARDTAMAYAERSQQLAPLEDIPRIVLWDESRWPENPDGTIKNVNEQELATACANAPTLDVVILQNGPKAGRHAQWTLPVSHVVSKDPAHILRDTTYYLYRCSDWRADG